MKAKPVGPRAVQILTEIIGLSPEQAEPFLAAQQALATGTPEKEAAKILLHAVEGLIKDAALPASAGARVWLEEEEDGSCWIVLAAGRSEDDLSVTYGGTAEMPLCFDWVMEVQKWIRQTRSYHAPQQQQRPGRFECIGEPCRCTGAEIWEGSCLGGGGYFNDENDQY